jgi:hypothetical protein
MDTHTDRRLCARVQLCAYGVDTVCIVMHGQKRCHLDLVDLSSGGARLKTKEALPEFADNRLVLSVHNVKDGGRLQNLPGQIRWRNGQEIGIQFDAKLDMALSELQNLIG